MIGNYSNEQAFALVNVLENICDDIDDVIFMYDDMIGKMKSNLLIDNEVVLKDNVMVNRKELEGINKEIINGVIPRIHNLY